MTEITVTQEQLIDWIETVCKPNKDWTNTYAVHVRQLERFLKHPENWDTEAFLEVIEKQRRK